MAKPLFILLLAPVISAQWQSALITGKPPPISPILSYLKDRGAVPEDSQGLDERLKFLVSHHPHPLVRKEMFREIYETQALAYAYEKGNGYLAQFMEAPGVVQAGKDRGKKVFLPIIALDPLLLGKLKSEDSVYQTLLVLYHEFLHYKQWKRSAGRERDSFRLSQSNQRVPVGDCEIIWKNEKEAYFKECGIAVSWGMPDIIMPGLCRTVSLPASFDHALYSALSGGRTKLAKDCRRIWARRNN